MTKYRITAVCLGNICRSPIAEAVLADRFAAGGLANLVSVDSAGTSDWHAGGDADPRALAILRQNDLPLRHRAKQFGQSLFADRDLILAMDRTNLAELRADAPDDDAIEKIRLLRSFDPSLMHLPEDDSELDVPDPYYGEADGFADVLRMVSAAADGVVDYVRLALPGHATNG